MTAKRLFVGRKTCEDRFTIITDYDGEIGVKENRSGDVLVLKHSDLNAQNFVAQLVVFLNDQNQAIVDLFEGSKYWSDKATEKIKELEKENEQLKQREEILLCEIEDFQTLLAKNDSVCHDRVIDLIDDRIFNFSNVRAELLLHSDDDYRLEKLSFAIQILRELKKELEE